MAIGPCPKAPPASWCYGTKKLLKSLKLFQNIATFSSQSASLVTARCTRSGLSCALDRSVLRTLACSSVRESHTSRGLLLQAVALIVVFPPLRPLCNVEDMQTSCVRAIFAIHTETCALFTENHLHFTACPSSSSPPSTASSIHLRRQ